MKAEVCQNLIERMPRRIRAIYKAKRGYTSADRCQFIVKMQKQQNPSHDITLLNKQYLDE
jgi:hypothetical protein